MRRSGVREAAVLLVAALAAGACSTATPPGSPGPTSAREPTSTPEPVPAPDAAAPSSGLYTRSQAERGRRVFDGVCSACHGRSEFRGAMFELTWMSRPIGDFFEHISTAMPQDVPGSLTPEEYAAVVAYVLQLNGRPAGDRELPADRDALYGIRWRP